MASLGRIFLAPVLKHGAFHVGGERGVVDHQAAPAFNAGCRRDAVSHAPLSQFMAAHMGRDGRDAVERDDLVED